MINKTALGVNDLRSVTTDDVNGDNKIDIIFIDATNNNMSVVALLNTGNGTFGTQLNYLARSPSYLACFTTADLDGDNKLDIIVAHTYDAKMGVFLNAGTGRFNPEVTYFAGNGNNQDWCSLATADVNDDNKLDIIITKSGRKKVGVFINTGIGTFDDQVTYFIDFSFNPTSLTIDDINADNKPDIIISNSVKNNIAILLSTDYDTFNTPLTYSTGSKSNPNFVTTDDLDGDNRPDIIVANIDASNIGIFLNTGNGTFNDQVTYSTGFSSRPDSLTTADVNGDNKPDIIVMRFSEKNPSIFLNMGNGSFYEQIIYQLNSTYYPRSITTADLNNDNKADIILLADSLIILFAC
jgi:hypothetical protein